MYIYIYIYDMILCWGVTYPHIETPVVPTPSGTGDVKTWLE